MRTADGERRMADGAFLKKKKKKRKEKKKESRMLILLNLLVNCHLLRNAKFGYFFFLILINLFLIVSQTAKPLQNVSSRFSTKSV